MGQRPLFAAGSALILAALAVAPLAAQGVQYRERWSYLHLEQRRAELAQALDGRDAATRQRVAELLAEPDQGVPYRPVARALAHLRGRACDDAFLLRSTLGVFLLPEVVDPVGDNAACRSAHVSLHLPFTVPIPADLEFVLEVRDAAGAVVHRQEEIEDVPLGELRMAQHSLEIPCAELPDGRYEMQLQLRIDGKLPGPGEPVVRWAFAVQRGYQAHATAAMQRAREAVEGLRGAERGWLAGLSRQVARAFAGEPFEGGSQALAELARLDAALANVAAGRPVLTGLVGDVPTSLPAADGAALGGLGAVLRLPAEPPPPDRPIVVVIAGAPSYDQTGRRPGSPVSRGPVWTSRELPALGRAAGWPVAFVESPGGSNQYLADLRAGLAALRELWPGQARPVVLVAEQQAATVLALQLPSLPGPIRGLACIGGGAMPGPTLDRLTALSLRYVAVVGSPSTESVQRTLAYAQARVGDGQAVDAEWLVAASQPFGVTLPLLAAPLQQWLDLLVP